MRQDAYSSCIEQGPIRHCLTVEGQARLSPSAGPGRAAQQDAEATGRRGPISACAGGACGDLCTAALRTRPRPPPPPPPLWSSLSSSRPTPPSGIHRKAPDPCAVCRSPEAHRLDAGPVLLALTLVAQGRRGPFPWSSSR